MARGFAYHTSYIVTLDRHVCIASPVGTPSLLSHCEVCGFAANTGRVRLRKADRDVRLFFTAAKIFSGSTSMQNACQLADRTWLAWEMLLPTDGLQIFHDVFVSELC